MGSRPHQSQCSCPTAFTPRRRQLTKPLHSGVKTTDEDLGLESARELRSHTSHIEHDIQHSTSQRQHNAGNGHSLIGGTPLVRRLNTQIPYNNRGDTSDETTAEETDKSKTEGPDPQ